MTAGLDTDGGHVVTSILPIQKDTPMLSTELPPKELIVLIACVIFFGLVLAIWIVARIFPKWDARQLARQLERQRWLEEL